MVVTVVVFIVGFSAIFSFDFGGNPPGFRPDAATTIFVGLLVAGIIYIADRYSSVRHRMCPACGRAVPLDALLCPYCGLRLP